MLSNHFSISLKSFLMLFSKVFASIGFAKADNPLAAAPNAKAPKKLRLELAQNL